MALDSMQEILERMEAEDKPFWQVVQDTDREERQVTAEASEEKMRATWQAMLESVTAYQGERMSLSGLVGGDGERMRRYAREKAAAERGLPAGGDRHGAVRGRVQRLHAQDCSGSHGRRLRCAAGGAGAAVSERTGRGGGDPPGAVCGGGHRRGGGLPGLHRRCRRWVPGGDRHCQRHGGRSADGLRGGSGEQVGHAVAMALKNLMGLICDPVAGLVEVPCVKRNVVGAVNAVSCADMALAGITSRVPVDQVIDCMGDVGRRLPVEFRETALGGLAATPFGQSVKEQLQSRRDSQET